MSIVPQTINRKISITTLHDYAKWGRDSRFFAADEANLSMKWWFAEVARKIENLGDENHVIVQTRKRAVWFLVEQYKSGSRYQIIQWSTTTNKLQPKNKIKDKTEQPQQQTTRNRQSVVRQETPSPRATPNRNRTTAKNEMSRFTHSFSKSHLIRELTWEHSVVFFYNHLFVLLNFAIFCMNFVNYLTFFT